RIRAAIDGERMRCEGAECAQCRTAGRPRAMSDGAGTRRGDDGRSEVPEEPAVRGRSAEAQRVRPEPSGSRYRASALHGQPERLDARVHTNTESAGAGAQSDSR